MVKKEIKSIILYLDSAAAIDYLTDEQAGILFKAVLRYGRDGQMLESSDTALTALFTMLCTQIDRDHKKYEERCERNVTNAKKRYEKQHQEEQPPAIACDRMPPHPNACHNDNNSDNDNKTDNDDDNADALIISDASVSDYSFETVWEMYGKPVGNVEVLKAKWNSLSAKNKDNILAYIPLYVASTPEVRYRKNFENFLSERYWETHPLNINTIQNETTINTYPALSGTERRTQQRQWLLQRFPTVEYFFNIFSPQRQLLICQDPTYCFFGPSPTLTEVDIMYGPFTSAKWLIPLIADASLSCGLKEDVTENQLQFTAMAIYGRFRWLKASELMLFFFNFKAGFYERFYSYFDTQTIIRSVKTFIEERALAIAAHERDL